MTRRNPNSPYAYPILHQIGSTDPRSAAPKARMNLTSADLHKATNGAFICLRKGADGKNVETYAVKVNGTLFPTCETRARALPRLAHVLGGTTKSWQEAWKLVNIPPYKS